MAEQQLQTDICIIGAGPAGLAAAAASLTGEQRVTVIDENHSLGGQIWRAEIGRGAHPDVIAVLNHQPHGQLQILNQATVIAAPSHGAILAELPNGSVTINWRKLILATGARERFLPFPGWTLPNVTGVGGIQALVKGGLSVDGKRVVVAGTGPLLPAVASFLRQRGAQIVAIAEQSPWQKILRFGLAVLADTARLRLTLSLARDLAGVSYLTNTFPVAAQGDDKLSSVSLRRGTRLWTVDCDYLACGFHLVPNLELALLLGCLTSDGKVTVDEWQQTSIPDVFCAGEPTGVGGLELAHLEGKIAGLAALGKLKVARKFLTQRDRARRFAHQIDFAFKLCPDLREVPSDQTTVCRCEDVKFGLLRHYDSWRAAKLFGRCGMGPCQGRVCGPAVEYLLGWRSESVRPPILPARISSLAGKCPGPANPNISIGDQDENGMEGSHACDDNRLYPQTRN